MAEIQMGSYETGDDRMPDVCMACGKSSCATISKRFSWYPPWILFLLPFMALLGGIPVAIMVAVMTKRMMVDVPVCESHRGYWWKRYSLVFVPLVALFGIAGITIYMVHDGPHQDNRVAGYVVLGSFAVGLLWLFIAALFQLLWIRPREITDNSITLKNVHEDFVEAYNEIRKQNRNEQAPPYAAGVTDYDEKLRLRRQRAAEFRTGYRSADPPDDPHAFRSKPDDA